MLLCIRDMSRVNIGFRFVVEETGFDRQAQKAEENICSRSGYLKKKSRSLWRLFCNLLTTSPHLDRRSSQAGN